MSATAVRHAVTELAVRRYEPGDRERVRELAREAMADTPEFVPGAPDPDLADVTGHYLDAGGEFLVGTVDGAGIVAMGAYGDLDDWKEPALDGPARPVREVTRMRVDPGWQRCGFGRTLYRELERRARNAGVGEFVLDTGAENDRARGFYEAMGFDRVMTKTIDFGVVFLELALYRKFLEAP